jgi:hypothetical protein
MRTATILAAFFALGAADPRGGGGKIRWQSHKNYEAALKEAKESGKAVMLYFTADF